MQDNEIFGGLFSDSVTEPEPIDVVLDEETHHIYPQEEVLYPAGNRVLDARLELNNLNEKNNELLLAKMQADRRVAAIMRENELRLTAALKEQERIKTALWDLRAPMRAAAQEVQQAEKAFRDALEAMRVSREFLANAKKFDDITAGLAWREWAFDYQIDGAKFIATAGRAICADKMGLGKSLTSLITADMLQVQKLLIIVPDDVVSNFAREVAQWAPHRSTITLGKRTKGEREAILSVLDGLNEYTVILNYSAWRKDRSLLKKLELLRFQMVIMDEAHTIKTTSTSAFLGCKAIVLSENSCPNCRGRIQRVYDSTAHVHDYMGKYIPRNYYACVGEVPVSKNDMTVDQINLSQSCGWSELADIVNDVERDYGAKRSVIYTLPMTGTPILNSPTDLFPMLMLLDDEQFNNRNEYIREYCYRDPYTNRIYFRDGGLESLVLRLKGRYIARDRRTAGVVLPKQEVRIHDLEFDADKYPGQLSVIKQLTKHAAIMLDSGKTMAVLAIIALITRKRQANVWPAGINLKDEDGNIVFSVGDEIQESIKLDKIIERPSTTESEEWEGMLPDFTGMGDMVNGERVVIFSQFKGPLEELETRCREAGISVVRFDGDTRPAVREQVKVDFNRKWLAENPDYTPQWQVCLANYKTGGVGLNFTDATQMIILDEEWNPGKEEQAMMRIDRIGQTEETMVHILRLNKTIDTWLANLIQEKAEIIEGFTDNVGTANELLDLLRQEDLE